MQVGAKAEIFTLTEKEQEVLRPFVPVKGAAADSRLLRAGEWFIAYPGENNDGRNYLDKAQEQGAAGFIYDASGGFEWQSALPQFAFSHLREKAGLVAAFLLDNDLIPLRPIGVTGTNGKTSISQWLTQALTLLGEKPCLIGTNGNGFWGNLESTTFTTPEAVLLQSILHRYIKQGASSLVMEVSSHGLSQHRVAGIPFLIGVFTNLTRDHLDYHGDMEAYYQAKKQLFLSPSMGYAIIHIDDPYGKRLSNELKKERPELEILGYGVNKQAHIHLHTVNESQEGIELNLTSPWGDIQLFHPHLIGFFNAQNLAASFAVLCVLGFEASLSAKILSGIKPAKGRMQVLKEKGKPLVIIDYAHTPDALQKALTVLKPAAQAGKLYCVFGCGGNRDQGKRSLMGQVVEETADYAVVTSDNPRDEDPIEIIADIIKNIHPKIVETDRKKAIQWAIEQANEGDVVLIAGKGHENYQEIKGTRYPFDEDEIALHYLKDKQ
jgi:UDP-N-acetylmuramoyl-L-alanyl-D-glutamate--2,6-diaminopimelate ligase